MESVRKCPVRLTLQLTDRSQTEFVTWLTSCHVVMIPYLDALVRNVVCTPIFPNQNYHKGVRDKSSNTERIRTFRDNLSAPSCPLKTGPIGFPIQNYDYALHNSPEQTTHTPSTSWRKPEIMWSCSRHSPSACISITSVLISSSRKFCKCIMQQKIRELLSNQKMVHN